MQDLRAFNFINLLRKRDFNHLFADWGKPKSHEIKTSK